MLGRKRTFEEACEDQKAAEQSTQVVTNINQGEQVFSKNLLQIYYDRLFPYQDMFNWLSYFNDPENKHPSINNKFWRNREFSFTLKDDIYVRYKSYKNLKEWKDDLRKRCPYKIDIGPLYNIEPIRRLTVSSDKFVAEEKELVFDIDISDYDDVRTCCKEASICNKCWPLMSCAVKVIDCILRNDFGLKHLLWVFSGRRGIHCWCNDDLIRTFDVQQRSAIIDYIKLYTGNTMNKYKVDMQIEKTRDIHESLNRSFNICLPFFINCSLKLQKVLDTEQGIEYFVNMIRFPSIANQVKIELMDIIDSDNYENKWKVINNIFQQNIKKIKSNTNRKNNNNEQVSPIKQSRVAIKANLMELVFSYVYPRLDVEVSRHVNHLLKSPFCIHPKTGKICSIIDPNTVETFDPLNQPTLLSLINQYNEAGKNKDNNNKQIGWRDTSLKDIVEVFRQTFLNNLQKEKMRLFKMNQQMEF